ncbi:hypothetical protein CR207_07870 [Chromobacterium violaceum]|uniref:hypothetical protein n=1 Tax=Chromobacterium violaceum TaxID=536 RepID=UPI000C127454|nr:hypothetical protein [Chromobacterium violaceum]ATP28317.1 hypothetical protein CRN81_07850 [Chromobacterium violaceum]ATP32225.1 hypothetical protein CR207_07870 [Chromobacterium violaceum]
MKLRGILAILALAAAGNAILSAPALADGWRDGDAWTWHQHQWHPEAHPYYLHAMSDLRLARDLLARPDYPRVMDDERHAVDEINKALRKMRDAAIDDGKDIDDRMPPDARWRPDDRFHQARMLLDKARQDATHREDDPYLRSLQRDIVHHIDEARRAVDVAVSDALR